MRWTERDHHDAFYEQGVWEMTSATSYRMTSIVTQGKNGELAYICTGFGRHQDSPQDAPSCDEWPKNPPCPVLGSLEVAPPPPLDVSLLPVELHPDPAHTHPWQTNVNTPFMLRLELRGAIPPLTMEIVGGTPGWAHASEPLDFDPAQVRLHGTPPTPGAHPVRVRVTDSCWDGARTAEAVFIIESYDPDWCPTTPAGCSPPAFDIAGTWDESYNCVEGGQCVDPNSQDSITIHPTSVPGQYTFGSLEAWGGSGTLCDTTFTWSGGHAGYYTESGTWTFADENHFTKTSDYTYIDSGVTGTCTGSAVRQGTGAVAPAPPLAPCP